MGDAVTGVRVRWCVGLWHVARFPSDGEPTPSPSWGFTVSPSCCRLQVVDFPRASAGISRRWRYNQLGHAASVRGGTGHPKGHDDSESMAEWGPAAEGVAEGVLPKYSEASGWLHRIVWGLRRPWCEVSTCTACTSPGLDGHDNWGSVDYPGTCHQGKLETAPTNSTRQYLLFTACRPGLVRPRGMDLDRVFTTAARRQPTRTPSRFSACWKRKPAGLSAASGRC